jgi:hypothetical protein
MVDIWISLTTSTGSLCSYVCVRDDMVSSFACEGKVGSFQFDEITDYKMRPDYSGKGANTISLTPSGLIKSYGAAV